MLEKGPEVRESVDSHPLYRSLKERCLVLVDEKGEALDRNKSMKTGGLPDLAVVHAIGENAEDPNVGYENCKQFIEFAITFLTSLTFWDNKKQFTYADPVLLTGGAPANLIVMEGLEPVHIEKLMLAYESSVLKEHVGLTFARLQVPRVEDEEYKGFCTGAKLPQHGTPARTILDRVKKMKNQHCLIDYDDRSADCILYTGGDFPKPGAYRDVEHLAEDGRIEIIKPHQLVYGLQMGVFMRATDQLRAERPLDVSDYIRERVDWLSFREGDSVSRDVFYFKSIK